MSEDASRASGGRRWRTLPARIGFGAKGMVYLVVGALAVHGVLVVRHGDNDGPTGALTALVDRPFGRIMLGALAAGLGTHALWCLWQAATGRANEPRTAAVYGRRLGQLGGAIAYFALARSALVVLSGDGMLLGGTVRDVTAAALALPLGRWLVAGAGVGLLAAGGHQIHRGVTAAFRDTFALDDMSGTERTWATRLGRTGHAARGLVWTVIGLIVIQAAWRANAAEAGGVGAALDTLAEDLPAGTWLLALTGAGLVGYGLHCLVEARYRRTAFL